MVEIPGPKYDSGVLDLPVDRLDVKDKDKKFQMPKAYGDKYVRRFANLIIGKNPIVKIGKVLATEYGDDVAKLGKKYKKQIFDAVFSKIDNIDFTTPQQLAKTFTKLGINPQPTNILKGQWWRNALKNLGDLSKRDADSVASQNYKKLTKESMSKSGTKQQKLITKEQSQAGQQAARLAIQQKNITEFFPKLQKTMIDEGLPINEAVEKIAGKKLHAATKHDQVIQRFYRYADEMKIQNPNLHKFFENEVKAYQIGQVFKKKLKYGTKEYEEARVALAKKLNIDVKDIERAHSMMAPRLARLEKLVDDGILTVAEANRLKKPQYFLLKKQNLEHVKLENSLDQLLQRKKNFIDTKDFTSANKTQEGIERVSKQMEDIGVESELFDPVKKLIKVFGRKPETVELYKMSKENIKNLGQGGMIQKFDNGGEAEATGISSEPLPEEQDTSGVAGLMDEDVNKFIPPNLRFAKNLTGNMVLDFGSEMARYMTPGLVRISLTRRL
jgi:hypothetical protein